MKVRIVLIIALLVLLFGVLIARNVDYSWDKYPMSMQAISDTEGKNAKIGISVEPGILNFGRIPVGSASEKPITLSNPEDRPVKIRMEASGSISEHVSFEKSEFILEGGGKEELYIRADGEKEGNFTGNLTVISVSISEGWLEWMLPVF